MPIAVGLLACGRGPEPAPPRDLLAEPHHVSAEGENPSLDNPVTLQGEPRPCLIAPTPSRVRFQLRLPERAVLTFAIGLKSLRPEAAPPSLAGRIRFSVYLGGSERSHEVFRRDLHPARAEQWIDQSVDLALYGGREVVLTFERSFVAEEDRSRGPGEGPPPFAALIADPIVHDRASYGRARAVVVISIDTLRRDHLSCYGYRRRTTPSLDALGRDDAAVFDDAVSTSSWTLPAHGSLLHSLHPTTHGAVNLRTALPGGLASLQGALRQAGFFTQAMVTHLYLSRVYGFAEGFDRHRYTPNLRARGVTDQAVGFLRSRGDRDFFLFLHYYDPHWHYMPPEPYNRSFDPNYRGSATGVWWSFKKLTRESVAPEDLAHIVALYDGEILYTDGEIERLFDELKRLQIFQRALIVVTSDHGEEFLEHGSWEHQKTLYEEQLRIPLLIKLPRGEGRNRRLPQQVSLIDVAPTVLDTLGVPRPASFQGRSLLPLIRGDETEPREAWAETEHTVDRSHKVALRRGAGREKWIVSFEPEVGRPAFEVYDLDADPAEQHDLSSRPGGLDRGFHRDFDRIRRSVESFLAEAKRHRRAPAPPVEHTPENLEQLRALGYVR